MSDFPPLHEPVNPVTRSAFRRQVWLEIYLPLVLGGGFLAAAAYLLWQSSLGSASAWADAATSLMLLPVLILALIPLVLLVAASAGLVILIRRLPTVSQRLQSLMYRVQVAVRRGADAAAAPVVIGESAGAGIGSWRARSGRRKASDE
jgi:hypothetical protein